MAVAPRRYVADTSAIARFRSQTVSSRLEPLIEAGSLETCSVIEMEVLRSARSQREFREIRDERRALPSIPTLQPDFDRAIEVMEQLAASGQLRRASLPDLLVSAIAERAGAVLLHYDADFDAIASVTSQATEWVVPRGSVP